MTRLRLGVLGIVVVSLFAVMFARLWYLQVLAAPQYEQASATNRVRLVSEAAPRGRILDRRGRVLVDNRVTDVVIASRADLRTRSAVLARLALLLKQPVAKLTKRLDDPRFSPFKPVPLAVDVPKDTAVYIKEHQDLFPGVDVARTAERSYRNGTIAAHALGYVGEVNDAELKARKGQGYRLGDTVGKTGVESVYEDALRGDAGIEKLEVDSRGKVLRSLGYRPPTQGDDVRLTLDLEVQQLAEESLAQGLKVARATFDKKENRSFAAPAGAVVVLDPRDGSVVALASNPTYDPASFLNGIKPDVFRGLQDPASSFPLTDRVTQGQYAPGSTFKLLTAIAALRTGLITPHTTIVDRGVYQLGRGRFRNAGGRVYGPLELSKAITVSSDVFFYTLGGDFYQRRGTPIQDTAREFGLGADTGVPLHHDANGWVPDPANRRARHNANPKAFPEGKWFGGDNVNLAIGQGEMLVTPLQLADAYATFANGGTVFAPRVADAVLDGAGKVVRTIPPVVTRKVDLPAAVRDPILAGLRGAVADPKGTAHGAFAGFPLDRLEVAGKTGTAQVGGKQDTALFVSMAPASAPEYVVAVVMEQSGFGGEAAAPVARRIYEGIAGLAPAPVGRAGAVD